MDSSVTTAILSFMNPTLTGLVFTAKPF